jgi:hypothetical protein
VCEVGPDAHERQVEVGSEGVAEAVAVVELCRVVAAVVSDPCVDGGRAWCSPRGIVLASVASETAGRALPLAESRQLRQSAPAVADGSGYRPRRAGRPGPRRVSDRRRPDPRTRPEMVVRTPSFDTALSVGCCPIGSTADTVPITRSSPASPGPQPGPCVVGEPESRLVPLGPVLSPRSGQTTGARISRRPRSPRTRTGSRTSR